VIGNDVVDLADTDSVVVAHHPKFDVRVFAAEERELLQRSADVERLRWSLWAAKESTFKLLRRSATALVFSPSRFVVRPTGKNSATVDAAGEAVDVRFESGGDFVHAVACHETLHREGIAFAVADAAAVLVRSSEDSTAAASGPDPATAGAAARRLALTTIARVLGERIESLSVSLDGRAPVLLRGGRPLPGTLSLSHHGRFVAFAWSPRSPLGLPCSAVRSGAHHSA
jgi:phosphopantetheinyl transferase (holo-ACP synthase)